MLFKRLTDAQDVFKSHKVILAYLFGSYARDTSLPISDVDIAVLLSDEIDRENYTDLQINLIVDLMKILERNDVDVVVLNTVSPIFRYKVFAEGKVVYCKSELARTRFEVKAMRDYFDTKRLRETLIKAYLERSA